MEEMNNWTGERLETFIYNEDTFEHLHRYALAIGYVENKVVLDIASGEGYGSNLLSKYAAKVYGVDIDKITIEKANVKYRPGNLIFKVGSADAIPLGDASVDVVVSFETLEHHDKHDEMFKEIKRVLKPSGVLVISTPEKKWYSDEKNYRNPFHVKELYFDEFKSLVKSYFNHSNFYFQNFFKGSVIIPEINAGSNLFFEGSYSNIEKVDGIKPLYLIAVASDTTLPMPAPSIFTSPDVDLMERQNQIAAHEAMRIKMREEIARGISNSRAYRLVSFLARQLKRFKK